MAIELLFNSWLNYQFTMQLNWQFMGSVPPDQLTHPKYRPDIDGLRAIAVLAVIGFHAFPNWVKGGFIGVDVFFVISGFLISTILLSSLETDRFSFLNFYAHRIRRIFPALALVIAACLAFGWFALLPNEYAELGKQAFAGSAFAANILFWRQSGYFDVAAELKPLLHLWSLGVEEQFYIVWPVLLWFAWKKRFNLLSIIIVIGVASLIYALLATKTNPVAGFYSPASRTWELLLGAFLAYWNLDKPGWLNQTRLRADAVLGRIVYTHPPEANGNTLRDIKALLGLALIIVGIFVISKERRFPGGWALLPTVGAFLMIAAGPHAWANRKILSQKLLVWIGLISYPLYLWHWPLLSFARIMEGETPSRSLRIAAVALSFLLAWLTYRLVERPLRWGKHLTLKAVSLTVAVAACGGFGFFIYQQQGFPTRTDWLAQQLKQFEWPETLNKNEQCKQLHPDAIGGYCNTTATRENERIMLIGDSHANHTYPGLAATVMTETGTTLLGSGGCPPLADVERLDANKSCTDTTNKALEIASRQGVETVVLLSRGPIYLTRKGFGEIEANTNVLIANKNRPEIKDQSQVFDIGLRNTLTRMQQADKKVVFVLDVPELGFDPKTCVDSRPLRLFNKATKTPCAVSRAEFEARNKPYRELVTRVAKDYPNVTLFDAAAPFCDDTWCWAIKDGQMLYRDDDHLSVEGSKFLAQELIKVLQ